MRSMLEYLGLEIALEKISQNVESDHTQYRKAMTCPGNTSLTNFSGLCAVWKAAPSLGVATLSFDFTTVFQI